MVVVQIASVELLASHSLVVKASDLGARGRGFNSHLWYSNIVLQNIEKQLFGNHISVHYMLIGSTQVLQGHCPLVLQGLLVQ